MRDVMIELTMRGKMNTNDKLKIDNLKLSLLNSIERMTNSRDSDSELRKLISDALSILADFECILNRQEVGDGYKNHIIAFFDTLSRTISDDPTPMRRYGIDQQGVPEGHALKRVKDAIASAYKALKFDYELFKKIGFGRKSTVIIGANGSGKSTLSAKLKVHMGNAGVSISAQRVLLIPNIEAISNPSQTLSQLRSSQVRDKTNKDPQEFSSLQSDFGIALKNLIAENIATGNSYRTKALACQRNSEKIPNPPKTQLDRTIEIWNDLIPQRVLTCPDSMNIIVREHHGEPYPASRMSDGEKVLLFLISQVLQAPSNGFIIIDEPEIYLHKSILGKIWDTLEQERDDCVFIYLTHDLSFASSRKLAGKIWIKSYSHPHDWDIQEVPANDIPEALVLELIGSRKDILFCEGKPDSLDSKIYNILFPQLTVVPVSSCLDVINYTRAFNRQNSTGTKAIGIIDLDYNPVDRGEKLNGDGVYFLGVAEIENLLLDEVFVTELAKKTMSDLGKIPELKESILEEFRKTIPNQAAMYVSAKIDYYFKDSNVRKGRDVEQIKANLKAFSDYVDVDEWYSERIDYLNSISSNDYDSVLRVFNNKGLKRKVMESLEIGDYEMRAIKVLNDSDLVGYLKRKYFHSDLANLGL